MTNKWWLVSCRFQFPSWQMTLACWSCSGLVAKNHPISWLMVAVFFLGMNAEKWRSAFCQKNIILPMTTLIDDVPIIIVLYSHDFHIEPKYKTCLSLWPSSLESGHFHQLGVGTMWSSLAVAVSDPMCRIPCSGWWLQIFLMCGLDFFFIPFPEKKNDSDIPYKSGCVFSFLLNGDWFQKTSWL